MAAMWPFCLVFILVALTHEVMQLRLLNLGRRWNMSVSTHCVRNVG